MFTNEILVELYTTILARKGASVESSYTAQLLAKGTKKISEKVGEEAVEVITAALAGSRKELAAESADLLYHLLVLWADKGVTPEEVMAVLAERKGISGIDEKQRRKK
jgi:phosphoribosyl-ATP pyrophosphohydrolase